MGRRSSTQQAFSPLRARLPRRMRHAADHRRKPRLRRIQKTAEGYDHVADDGNPRLRQIVGV